MRVIIWPPISLAATQVLGNKANSLCTYPLSKTDWCGSLATMNFVLGLVMGWKIKDIMDMH